MLQGKLTLSSLSKIQFSFQFFSLVSWSNGLNNRQRSENLSDWPFKKCPKLDC